jgi:hypothetical protein
VISANAPRILSPSCLSESLYQPESSRTKIEDVDFSVASRNQSLHTSISMAAGATSSSVVVLDTSSKALSVAQSSVERRYDESAAPAVTRLSLAQPYTKTAVCDANTTPTTISNVGASSEEKYDNTVEANVSSSDMRDAVIEQTVFTKSVEAVAETPLRSLRGLSRSILHSQRCWHDIPQSQFGELR